MARATSRSSAGINSTAIHIRSRPAQKYIQMAVDEGRPEEDVVRASMIEHDEQVGSLLKKLEELGIDDNTIVIYSTDNGNELMLWPDGGYAPFRGEKGTTWEGGLRVPMMVKWPGHIKPGQVESMASRTTKMSIVTLAAAAGLPEPQARPAHGLQDGRHDLQGPSRRLQPTRLCGRAKSEQSARREFFYYDETDLMAFRVDPWKMHIGVKTEGSWFERQVLPQHSVFLQLADGPAWRRWIGIRKSGATASKQFFAHKMWAPNAAGPFIGRASKEPDGISAAPESRHVSIKKALEEMQEKMERAAAGGGNN